jgi:hypothetical protein
VLSGAGGNDVVEGGDGDDNLVEHLGNDASGSCRPRDGFADVSIEFTHAVGDGVHAAIVRAVKPAAR